MSKRSRIWRDFIKRGRPGSLARVVEELVARAEAAELRNRLLGSDVVLVPTPRSAPLRPGTLWPSRMICDELLEKGLAAAIHPCLKRVKAVRKSAFAARGERPTTHDHAASMLATPGLLPPKRLLLVDDFVTKGATLLAGASLLSAAFPDVEVQCFALVRTMGLVPNVDRIVAPCLGSLRLTESGEVDRTP